MRQTVVIVNGFDKLANDSKLDTTTINVVTP